MYSPLHVAWDYAIRMGAPRVTYADFYYPNTAESPTISNIPIESFNLSVDRRGDIRRTCELTIVSEDLLLELKKATTGGSSIEPYGGEIRLRHGVIISDTLEESTVPLGVFHIEKMTYEDPGARMNFELVDRSMILKRKLYGFPRNAGGQDKVAVVMHPVTNEMPYVTQIVDPAVVTSKIPGGVMHRGDMLTIVHETAESLAAEFFFDQNGNACLSPAAKLDATFNGIPDWEVDAGEEGVLVKAGVSVNRGDTYNRVLVIGVNPSEGVAAVYADVQDNDPSSSTYYYGPFGQADKWIDDNTMTTYAACLARANQELANHKGLSRTLDLVCLGNPALDVGDIIRVTYLDGTRAFYLVDSYNLDHAGTMRINTRTERVQL